MRNDSTAPPSPNEAEWPPRSAKEQFAPADAEWPPRSPKGQFVPIDLSRPEDTAEVFLSPRPMGTGAAIATAGNEAIRVSVLTSEKHAATKEVTTPQPQVRSWRNIALSLLAVVVLVQSGLMAYWMLGSPAIGAAAQETGSVRVTSDPSGSPVTIDGAVRGITPLTISLAAGSHSIAVGAGVQLRSQTVNINRGSDASLYVELPSAPASSGGLGGLQISSEPSGARVSIDGEPRGVTPLTVSNLKVGDHVVTVNGASGEAVRRTVTVQEATVASLIVSTSGSNAFASGWLAVTSGVPLQIMEKGTLVGTTDTPRLLLPAGTHDLELVNASLSYRVSRTVQVSAGQTSSIAIRPPMGTLSVNALPWAEVWIDGERAGETPIGNLSIVIGNHELVFRHPDLGEQRKTVTVGAQAPVRVGVTMGKP